MAWLIGNKSGQGMGKTEVSRILVSYFQPE